jgi:predicted transcriptional regulator
VGPEDSIIKAIYLMMDKNLAILPVIDQGVVKGVIRFKEIFKELALLVMGD